MKRFLAISSLLMLAAGGSAQNPQQAQEKNVNRDPDAARLVTSDINNFWKAYDQSRPDYCLAPFKAHYFGKASDGLKAFKRVRIDQCSFIETLDSHPRYYDSIRASTLRIKTFAEPIRASLREFKSLYDDAVFPNVYFLIGCMNSGGTVTPAGLLIGAEMYGRTPNTPEEELSEWHKQVLKPVELLPHIVAHELIHYQQKYSGGGTLLVAAIREGSADFIAELISGRHINTHVHEYGNPRERQLWEEFKQEMRGTATSKWLFGSSQTKDRPADVGYFMGYKICESYYRQASDKKQAIKEILEIKDFNEFLRTSKYEEKLVSLKVRQQSSRTLLPGQLRLGAKP